jgi:deoxyribose-phosphate aldolase
VILRDAAKRALSLLDLTNLNDPCTEQDVADLCQRAVTPHGDVAALCIWPKWVKRARELVKPSIRVATVVNFPHGNPNADAAVRETKSALHDGADEIDMVMPYQTLLAGDAATAARVVRACRHAIPDGRPFKVIIESGVLNSRGHILLASQIALDEGADFIKTSTGKVAVNATPFAAEIMLNAIRRSGYPAGFKAAGGIRTTQDAAFYLKLADDIMGAGWANASRFRFGASGVLTDLIAVLDGKAPASASSGY